MGNVLASSNGSGVWSQQKAYLPHLLHNGLSAEVGFVRKDLQAVLSPEIGETVDEFDGPGSGAVLVLTYPPKIRLGATLVLREMLDGANVSPITGTITQPGGVGTPWVYTPATAPNAATAGVVTGTADCSQAALYGATGTLNGLTLILTVNGNNHTLTFSDPVNPTNIPYPSPTVLNPPLSMLQIIDNAFPGLTATLNGSNFLLLTNKFSGTTQTIVVGAGTANTALGLSAGTTAGTGHSYAVFYEYDGTQIPNASTTVVGGTPPYVNTNQGP